MTDPFESYDVELLKKYDAELGELESLPPATIELTARQALALVTHMQIAAATNPGVKSNPLLPSAIAAAKQIQSSFNPDSAIHEVLELGWGEQMTDPLQSYDVELLKKYDAELGELESLPPAAIKLTARQALALVTYMQIAAADPAVKYNPLLPSAIAAAKQIQSSFNPESAIHEVLELGWQPEVSSEDVPQQIFTSVSRRQKKLRPSPYFPDDNHHF
jgi:hypothetical protein